MKTKKSGGQIFQFFDGSNFQIFRFSVNLKVKVKKMNNNFEKSEGLFSKPLYVQKIKTYKIWGVFVF